jgi:hypothetical protein
MSSSEKTGSEQSDAGAQRRRAGLFRPGVSGNPNGRPRKTAADREAERLSRAEAQVAIERLMGKALTTIERALGSKDETVALRAAVDVLDRGIGKAMQRVDAAITSNETVTMVSPAMLRTAAMRLLAANADDVEDSNARA